MTVSTTERTFRTVQLGPKSIHRVALAPLTRLRNIRDKQVPTDLATQYYGQRASEGGLLITEATFIAREAAGYPYAPGIYSKEQIEAWKKVTDAVHAKKGYIFTQLWALGRANCDPPLHDHMPDVKTVAPSPIGLKPEYQPEELSLDDIKRYIGHYRQAAQNADEAGFDGVEVHGANGYLPDQFLQSVSNKRTDAYGGSLENRAKFLLEAVAAAVDVLGAERVGLRLSPWGTFQEMGETNPYVPFEYVIKELVARHSKLAYIHFVEPREWTPGAASTDHHDEGVVPSNDRFRAIIRGVDPESVGTDESFKFEDPTAEHPTLVLSAGGFNLENVGAHIERTGDVVAFGRPFIANPDLPARVKKNIPFNKYNRDTFYQHGAEGYIDYPTADEVAVKA